MKENILAKFKLGGITDIFSSMLSIAAFAPASGKPPTKAMLQPHITELLEFCDMQGISTLIVSNAPYFKFLTGLAFEASIGDVYNCTINDYEHIAVLPLVNPLVVKVTPGKRPLLEQSFKVAIDFLKGTFVPQEEFAFKTYEMIDSIPKAREVFNYLKQQKVLAWDIETTGLHHLRNDFVTQAFAVSESEAYTFVCHEKYLGAEDAKEMHELFKDFFLTTKSKIIVHNMGFESKFLMSKYVMGDYLDYKPMYKFLKVFDWEDTMLMGYALYNSTERISLSLKDLAKPRYGDWDSDIDVRDAINQPLDKLAYYNAIDVSATFYLYNTLGADLKDGQRSFYENEMKETQRTFTKIMCTGLPMDMPSVLKAEEELTTRLEELNETFYKNFYVREATADLRDKLARKYNETHKVKQVTAEYFTDTKFNPNSNAQLQDLLFDTLGFISTEKTKSGAPSTAREVVEGFLETTTDPTTKELLECLIGFSEVSIILNTFISSFKNDSVEVAPGIFRLYSNLRVAGTISFRPTASNPNSLNMPSNSQYGSLLKQCFKAPEGFVTTASDYASLQGVTAANLTGDKASIKIYGEEIDLHALIKELIG